MWIAVLISVLANVAAVKLSSMQADDVLDRAKRCVLTLSHFGTVQSDFFPTGLEKAKRKELFDKVDWPPPATVSWRIAILPFLEEGPLYASIFSATSKFSRSLDRIDPSANGAKRLSDLLKERPDWLAVTSGDRERLDTPFRRVVVESDPSIFIVVESSVTVMWYQGNDDIVLKRDQRIPAAIGGVYKTGFFALCGDGRVRFISKSLSDKEIYVALVAGDGIDAIATRKQVDIEARLKKLGLTDAASK